MILLHDIVMMCRNHPEILIFLSLGIGYYIGEFNFFGFSFGSTAGVLLASLILGQLDVTITPLIKSVSFALFIFTIGYKVGPEFFGSLKKQGFSYIIISIFFALVGLITAIILGKLFGFDKGTTAGLLAGALTQSSVLGTAEEAIRKLPIALSQQDILSSDMAVAYAITYIFGVAGLVIFYKVVPRLLNINFKVEVQKINTQLGQTVHHPNQHNDKTTNIIMLGFGCFLGVLLGLIAIRIGDIPLTLGVGGGVLLAGLLCGWLQTIYPAFGIIPEASQWVLISLGLNLFIACVGLTAGPKAIAALQTHGAPLFFAGVALTLIPHVLTLLFGMLFFKLNPVLLLGALTGAGTATPALNVLKEDADSATPAVGYTIPYAIGNFILTIWGTIIVNLM
jgi:AspT/YidE/YbjL antiporter-like protein